MWAKVSHCQDGNKEIRFYKKRKDGNGCSRHSDIHGPNEIEGFLIKKDDAIRCSIQNLINISFFTYA